MTQTTIIPMFDTTIEDDFDVITDSIDRRLHIIVHQPTGYFNITKIAALVHRMKEEDNASDNRPKKINHWMDNADTQELFQCCMEEVNIDEVQYKLRAGTPERFMGIYIHELVYPQFMQWLDKKYAMKVSILLKKHRDTFNDTLINSMDNKIIELTELLNGYDDVFDATNYSDSESDESDTDSE